MTMTAKQIRDDGDIYGGDDDDGDGGDDDDDDDLAQGRHLIFQRYCL